MLTDNKSLAEVLFNDKNLKKILRWLLEIAEFTFTPIHRGGKSNNNVDALSRLVHGDKEKSKNQKMVESFKR